MKYSNYAITSLAQSERNLTVNSTASVDSYDNSFIPVIPSVNIPSLYTI